MSNNLIQTAKMYRDKGLVTLPCSEKKIPLYKGWQKLTLEDLTDKFIQKWFGWDVCKYIGLRTGWTDIEVIDLDLKYDLNCNEHSNGVADDLFQKIIDYGAGKLLKKMVLQETPSGGYHLFYRCKEIEGNQKLASRPPTDKELEENPHLKSFVLLETRGVGGQVIVSPSKGYEILDGRNIWDVGYIEPHERDLILGFCREFDQMPKIELPKPVFYGSGKERPAAIVDWEKKTDFVQYLISKGWRQKGTDGKRIFMQRPGKNAQDGQSGNYMPSINKFKVWSTSTQFATNVAYSPFDVFKVIEHRGCFKSAIRDLESRGFGKKIEFN